MTPSERLRQLADWCDRHGITAEDVVSIGIYYRGATAHIDHEAGRRLFAGQTLPVGRNGFVHEGLDGVPIVFHPGPCVEYSITIPPLEAARNWK